MVSKYTRGLIDVIEEEAKVNKLTAIPLIIPS